MFNYYKLKIFAEEAEWNQNIDKAGKIYREQIANCNENLSCWFDYSTFCFRNNFEELGLEALNEVIGRDDKFVKGLIAHAMISFSKERFEETRTFLLQAISLDPKNVVVNCMMVNYC